MKTSHLLLILSLISGLFPLSFDGVAIQSLAESPINQVTIQQAASDPLFYQQTNLQQVRIQQAWDITTGTNTVIAVIDTGVAINHDDLTNKFWVNPNEIPNNHIDDDNNGYVDDINGYNFYQNNTDVSDQNGHGTAIAGIIAAQANNGKGIAGINWNAKLMVLKALNSLGGGEYNNVANAIRYAADNGARIINMSFGTYVDSLDLAQAVNYAVGKGVIIAAAGGNNSKNQLLYPAAYSNVIAVGAVDGAGYRASFSNYGTNLDVMAPGVGIPSASYITHEAYASNSGTSFATAHVTGLVSLMLARNASLTPAQAESILKNTATPRGSATEYGSGIIDMPGALLSIQQASIITGAITASRTTLPADQGTYSQVTVTVKDGATLVANHLVRMRIEGGEILLGGTTVNGEVDLGPTNQQGSVTALIGSRWSGSRKLVFSDATALRDVGSLTLVFTPMGTQRYSAAWVRQSPYPTLNLNEETTLWVELRNTGNMPWFGSGSNSQTPFRFGTFRPMDRKSIFYHSTWISPNRTAVLEQTQVNPGEIGRFSFLIKATQPGVYKEYFNAVLEYKQWMPDLGIYWTVTVKTGGVDQNPSHYQAELVNQTASPTLTPGQIAFVSVTLKNSGIAKWNSLVSGGYGTVKLGTVNPPDRNSRFSVDSWSSPNRAITTGFEVAPGGTMTLGFNIKAPTTTGSYIESFRLVSEHIAWFGPVITWNIKVS
ncbi:S8 family serine peptidase [Patescibacteria group bacterium]|nr:S8 family serine peptidase [Patescibacteria group bacterium]